MLIANARIAATATETVKPARNTTENPAPVQTAEKTAGISRKITGGKKQANQAAD